MAPTPNEAGPPPGPPYAPVHAVLGGIPTKAVDVPLAAVCLALYIIGAICHNRIFVLGYRARQKFLMSVLVFAYCKTRMFSMFLRMAWACYPWDVPLGIAASVFMSAGVLLLYIVNLLFAQRIIKTSHPRLASHRAFRWSFIVLYVVIVACMVMIITSIIQTYYTLDMATRRIDHDILLGATTYMFSFAVLPLPLLALNAVLPRSSAVRRREKPGRGRRRFNIAILLLSTLLLATGSGWRVVTNYLAPHPIQSPPWYYHKVYFWVFNIAVELLVAYLYIVIRIDLRIHTQSSGKKAAPADPPVPQSERSSLRWSKGSGSSGTASSISSAATVTAAPAAAADDLGMYPPPATMVVQATLLPEEVVFDDWVDSGVESGNGDLESVRDKEAWISMSVLGDIGRKENWIEEVVTLPGSRG